LGAGSGVQTGDVTQVIGQLLDANGIKGGALSFYLYLPASKTGETRPR
jgi:hypothetical protein